MDISINILQSWIDYPKGTLLFFIALLNLYWVFYIVFIKKGFKENIYRAYFVYAFFAITWVISNAYFQSSFLIPLGKEVAKGMALLANIAVPCSIVGFYLISSFVRRSKISLFSRILIIFLILETLVLNLIPGLTVKEVMIFEDGSFQLIQGNWTGAFFLVSIIVVLMSVYNMIMAIRHNKAKIENVRVFYILFGMTLLYSSVILFLVVFPYFFQNYTYAWIPPFMSIADVLIVGYAIVTQRFFDIRLLISRFFKVLTAFFFSALISISLANWLSTIFDDIEIVYWHYIGIAFSLLLFCKFFGLINSRIFYGYFGGTDVEHITHITNDLRKKGKVYPSIKSYEQDLNTAFSKKMKGVSPKIYVINDSFSKKFPRLIKHFRKHRPALVTEELRFAESNRSRVIPLLRELESLGGICFPLYHPTKGLSALFTLGRKQYSHLYSKQEIYALETLSSYVNVTVINILYNHELQTEVAKKTKQLKDKIEQINELLQQQSDFIAVTAHEFRTPLSIATFQLDDTLSSKDISRHLKKELKVVHTSLNNLRQLTEKLFAVQQYDLKRVKLKLEKIDLIKFIKVLYKDFIPIMQQRNLSFTQKFDIKGHVFVNADSAQLRQVLHNLLTNASKFTPKNGAVTIEVARVKKNIIVKISDDGKGVPEFLKKTIFDKFRTKNAGSGIGLGLYLCKKIIKLHKGKIWVEDNEPQGASFCILLKELSN